MKINFDKAYCTFKAHHIASTQHKMTSILYRSTKKRHSLIKNHHNFYLVQHI